MIDEIKSSVDADEFVKIILMSLVIKSGIKKRDRQTLLKIHPALPC
jgi:hypothetical protein